MSHRAAVLNEPNGKLIIKTIPTPTPEKGQLLIKNVASALNPGDWKQVDHNVMIPSYPFVVGFDIAGIVEKVGEGVTNFKKGDKVFSFTPVGKDIKYGGYQEYTITEAEFTSKFPDNIDFSQASTVGTGFMTGLISFKDLGIYLFQTPPSDTILIWGGSTNSGIFGIQLAKIVGFKNIITTCSPKNNDLVKSLGATQVFDYKDPDVTKKIKEATNGKLSLIYDTIGAGQILFGNFGSDGGTIVSIVPDSIKDAPSNIKVFFPFAGTIYTDEQSAKIGKEGIKVVEEWLASGKLKPNQVEHLPNGLAGIEKGFTLLKEGKVSAKKLVFLLDENPK